MLPKGLVFIFIQVFCILTAGFAADDGFSSAGKVTTKHFTVYYEPGVDFTYLSKQLNIGLEDKLLAGTATANEGLTPEEEFGKFMDTLFIRICDILDMRLYRFKGEIKICRDDSCLSRMYSLFSEKNSYHQQSFYAPAVNTIYLSAQNFKLGITGHEIAHAIISNYFVVLPSTKIQEVLAGYVEYQLRKGDSP